MFATLNNLPKNIIQENNNKKSIKRNLPTPNFNNKKIKNN